MASENFNFILSYLKSENINIDTDEFLFQLETHPDYPSLYSVSDTLRFFKVNNIAAKLPKEDVDQLPEHFVALVRPEKTSAYLTFVSKNESEYTYSEGEQKITISKEDFLNIWQEVVLIVEKTDDVLSTKTNRKNLTWPLFTVLAAMLMFTILTFTGFSWGMVLITILGFAGIFLSIEALKQAYGVHSSFSNAVCFSSEAQASDCKSVIVSDKAMTIWGLGLSDFSIIFFVGHLLSLFFMSIAGFSQLFLNYSTLLLSLGVPICLYSIYYQKFIEKKWCPICLMIIGVFALELTSLFVFTDLILESINFNAAVLLILGFASALISWVFVKPYIKELSELQESEKKHLRFKRNYPLFKLAILDSDKYDNQVLRSDITIGNPNAHFRITIITNLFCGHCAKAHKIIEELYSLYTDELLINIRFNYIDKQMSFSKDIHVRLLDIYYRDGQQAFLNALGHWFTHKNFEMWSKSFGGIVNKSNKYENLLKAQFDLNVANKLQFTPAILLGQYLYPSMYEREDLVYYINELIDEGHLYHLIEKKELTDSIS